MLGFLGIDNNQGTLVFKKKKRKVKNRSLRWKWVGSRRAKAISIIFGENSFRLVW